MVWGNMGLLAGCKDCCFSYDPSIKEKTIHEQAILFLKEKFDNEVEEKEEFRGRASLFDECNEERHKLIDEKMDLENDLAESEERCNTFQGTIKSLKEEIEFQKDGKTKLEAEKEEQAQRIKNLEETVKKFEDKLSCEGTVVCHLCGGTGSIEDNYTCPECCGTGKIDAPQEEELRETDDFYR